MTADLIRALTAAREAVDLGEKATPGGSLGRRAASALRDHASSHYPTVARALIAQAERVRVLEGLLQRSRDVLAGSPEADHSGNVRALLAAINAALAGGRDGS